MGNKAFTVAESPGKITFFDNAKKEGISISGSSIDGAAIKKDMAEYFKNFAFSPIRADITQYISQQQLKDNNAYKGTIIERLNNAALTVQSGQQKDSSHEQKDFKHQIETAEKTGYVQGVCECVAVVSGHNKDMGIKLLSEMHVTKDMAKKFANPATFKAMEQNIFAPKPAQKLEQTHSIKR